MEARLHFSIALLIVLAVLPIPAAAQDAASAKTFLQSVYALYAKNGKGATLTSRYYDSTLLRLVATDNKLNAGDIGVLEGDPVCGCQDWAGIWDLKIEIGMMQDPNLALADVTFALFPRRMSHRKKDDLRKLQFTLCAGAPANGGFMTLLTTPTPRRPLPAAEANSKKTLLAFAKSPK